MLKNNRTYPLADELPDPDGAFRLERYKKQLRTARLLGVFSDQLKRLPQGSVLRPRLAGAYREWQAQYGIVRGCTLVFADDSTLLVEEFEVKANRPNVGWILSGGDCHLLHELIPERIPMRVIPPPSSTP